MSYGLSEHLSNLGGVQDKGKILKGWYLFLVQKSCRIFGGYILWVRFWGYFSKVNTVVRHSTVVFPSVWYCTVCGIIYAGRNILWCDTRVFCTTNAVKQHAIIATVNFSPCDDRQTKIMKKYDESKLQSSGTVTVCFLTPERQMAYVPPTYQIAIIWRIQFVISRYFV